MKRKSLRFYAKLAAMLVVACLLCTAFFAQGLAGYRQCKVYDFKNKLAADSIPVDFSVGVTQAFVSKGGSAASVRVYVQAVANPAARLTVAVGTEEKSLATAETDGASLVAGAWNTIQLNTPALRRGQTYLVSLSADEPGLSGLQNTEANGACTVGGAAVAGSAAVGLHQLYYYMQAEDVLLLACRVGQLMLLLLAAFCAIWHFEDALAALRRQNAGQTLWYALPTALYCMLLFNPMQRSNTAVKSFNRTFGAGIIAGYDVSRAAANFAEWFAAFALALGLAALCAAWLRSREYRPAQRQMWDCLDDFMPLATASLVLRCAAFFANESTVETVFCYSAQLLGLVLAAQLAYILLGLDGIIGPEAYRPLTVALLGLGVPASVCLLRWGRWSEGRLLFGVQGLLVLGAAVALLWLKKRQKPLPEKWGGPALAAACCPLLLAVYLEGVNIAAGRGACLPWPRAGYLLFCILLAGICALALRKKNLVQLKSAIYPLFLFGMAQLMAVPPLSAAYEANVYETANCSVLTTDFLHFGSIPLVEHYGGHMLVGVVENILYALLNNDGFGAAFGPYSGYVLPVMALLLYFVLRQLTDEDTALWAALLLPLLDYFETFAIGLAAVLACIGFLRKNTAARAALLWGACAWATLWRLDLGFSVDLAVLLTLAVWLVVYKKWDAVRPLALTFACYGAAFGGGWAVLCLAKGINPATRLLEFLTISASNRNWAYGYIGDAGLAAYSWHYLLLPVAVAVALGYAIFSQRFRQKAGEPRWAAVLLLGAAYFANFTRALNRHSLVEGVTGTVMWTAYLTLALFAACLLGKRLLLAALTALLLLSALFAGDEVFSALPAADRAVQNSGSFLDAWVVPALEVQDADPGTALLSDWQQQCRTPVQRVTATKEVADKMEPLAPILDTYLAGNETYLDFMNRSFGYSYFGRRDPVYVSQSPMQLSGEFAQNCYVAELRKNRPVMPLVLLPCADNTGYTADNLDGIANVYRYYKVAEYLYQNYRPLSRNGEFAVWCDKARYDELAARLPSRQAENLVDTLAQNAALFQRKSMTVTGGDGRLLLTATGEDPQLPNIHNLIDVSAFAGKNVTLEFCCKSDVAGKIELFYTTAAGEAFNEAHSLSKDVGSEYTILNFTVPVAQGTRLRLDTPDNSTVTLTSVKVKSSEIAEITYGYDRTETNISGGLYIDDAHSLHVYNLNRLPQLWGEYDTEKAAQNPIAAAVTAENGVYKIENADSINKTNGNYLKLTATFAGYDTKAGPLPQDERTRDVTLRMGRMDGDSFVEKYRYTFNLGEGTHDYLLRISSDYFWYSEPIDTVVFSCRDPLTNVQMSILQGD